MENGKLLLPRAAKGGGARRLHRGAELGERCGRYLGMYSVRNAKYNIYTVV